MKYLHNWLKKLFNTRKSTEQSVDPLITNAPEAEGIEQSEESLGNVVVGEILEIQKHPNADKLSVAKVDVGEEKPRQIVFGQMAEIKVGNKTPVALAPTILPGNKEIKKVELRGVYSEGMLCLDQELGLKKEGVSITLFDKNIKNGTSIKEVLNLGDWSKNVTKPRRIVIEDKEEKALIAELNKRNDVNAERIKRLLALPDLTKKENSPVKIINDKILSLPVWVDFDVVDIPKIVTTEDDFDLLNTPQDHPSRRESDTYYLDQNHILRTQMTVMWPYYFRDDEVLERLKRDGEVGSLSPGIVWRKDEIDNKHYPAFHQTDFLYVCRKDKRIITLKELQDIQADAIKAIFGDIEFRFLVDTFPFTDPSTQAEINWNGNWIEITGAGLVHPNCLRNFGLDPEIYNGYAGTFGLDRVAMIKMGIPDIRILWSDDSRITSQFKDINSKYKEVSKFPQTTRDISFIINKDINLNNYYEIVRDFADDLIEEVKLIDEYENEEKFGKDKKSYTFRIAYRSLERTLTNEEINKIQLEIRTKTEKDLKAVLR